MKRGLARPETTRRRHSRTQREQRMLGYTGVSPLSHSVSPPGIVLTVLYVLIAYAAEPFVHSHEYPTGILRLPLNSSSSPCIFNGGRRCIAIVDIVTLIVRYQWVSMNRITSLYCLQVLLMKTWNKSIYTSTLATATRYAAWHALGDESRCTGVLH